MTGPAYDPRDPEIHADPYPAYRALRERDPMRLVPGARLWFLTRHRDCLAVLGDARFSARQGQRLRQASSRSMPSKVWSGVSGKTWMPSSHCGWAPAS
ncbi:hypothetical protein AB0C32_45115, partial [Streptosporangium sp. NPDC048865]